MAPRRQTSRTVSLREDTQPVFESMPDVHRVWLAALAELAFAQGNPIYVGRWSANGRVPFRIYADDAQLEGFLLASDDPGKVLVNAATRIWNDRLAEDMARLAERRLARTAQDAPKAPR